MSAALDEPAEPGERDAARARLMLYTVVREDVFQRTEDGWKTGEPSSLSGLRGYWSIDEAVAECLRLNALNGAKGCAYHVVWVRLTREELLMAQPSGPA